MKTIPLTQGKVAIVDDADYDLLSQYSWYATKVVKKRQVFWYARTSLTINGTRRHIFMHTYLIGAKPVNHRDFNTLNNQRANLEGCSYSQNGRWRRKSNGKSSRFKGVTWHKRGKVWQAAIRANGTYMYLGRSDSEKDAAVLYNVAAQLFFGEFAYLNQV